ncbi:GRAM domain-containing protein 4-like isoform X1 [Octopus sinensis]|uniref:GRAM domain-containing protein 4-like isoform X1 n=1 Tax=Octopus sinensis TaxID=2607531 RepID=A0A7E6F579_9MOLL|nr:GRAM domain-containing protein 4-like isoform X1 [Octopus sinensis]
MSLRNAIRARFRNADKSERGAGPTAVGATGCGGSVGVGGSIGEEKEKDKEKDEEISSAPSSTMTPAVNSSNRKVSRPGKMNIPKDEEDTSTFELITADREGENSSLSGQGTPESPRSECIHPLNSEERVSFEQQLTHLQEQLVAIMIENQALSSELQEYKKACQFEKVKQELDYEKSRNVHLEEKCQSLEKRRRKVQRSKSDATHHVSPDETDANEVKDRSLPTEDREVVNDLTDVNSIGPKTRWQRIWDAVVDQISEVINDFSEVPEPNPEIDSEGDPLTVRKLKNNITRFGAVTQPIMNTMRGLKNLISWRSPSYTLFVFTVYMYSAWYGLLLPLCLFLIFFRLSISYMRYKGWNINLHYLDPGEIVNESDDKDKGVSDKFSVVLQVAKKVQNTLGVLADTLEKVNSLLTWRYPPATKQLYVTVCLAFLVSCLFQASAIFYVAGILLGIKVFIIDYMFEHFPRLKEKYDSSHRLWENLPTESEYRKKTTRVQIDKVASFLNIHHQDTSCQAKTKPFDLYHEPSHNSCNSKPRFEILAHLLAAIDIDDPKAESIIKKFQHILAEKWEKYSSAATHFENELSSLSRGSFTFSENAFDLTPKHSLDIFSVLPLSQGKSKECNTNEQNIDFHSSFSSGINIIETQVNNVKHILPLSQFEDRDDIDHMVDLMTDDDKSFCELFNLPLSENPLPGWQGGRRCALINKDKSLTAAFKNGKLFLTRSFLCFERTKSPSSKNFVLPLSDIVKLERAKPYPWLPGGGMAIEVTMAGSDKPYIFGALLNREECYQSIHTAGSAGGWACPEPSSGSISSSSSSPVSSAISQPKSSPHKRHIQRSQTLRFDENVAYAISDNDNHC